MALPLIGPIVGAVGAGLGAAGGPGALIGPALGAAGTIIGGRSQSNAIRDANAASIQAQREANAANQKLFRESRGAPTDDGIVSAVLPEFFNTPEGSFEAQLANEIISRFSQSGEIDTSGLEAAQGAGDQLIGDIFSGEVANQRLGLAEAISEAEKAGISAGLQETLQNIRAARSTAGLGDSSFTTRAATQATSAARRAQGAVEAARAKQLFDEDVNLRLGLLDVPSARISQAHSIPFAPVDQTLARLGFFNIGPGNPPSQVPIPTTAIPGSGQAIGAGLSAFGSAFGDHVNTQALLKFLSKGSNTGHTIQPIDPNIAFPQPPGFTLTGG